MPSITLHPPAPRDRSEIPPNALPSILHTPSGLAMIEIQGTINAPSNTSAGHEEEPSHDFHNGSVQETPIGKIVFPDWSPDASGSKDANARSKRVYLYIGKHQRMTGEVKELKNPMALIRRRNRTGGVNVTNNDGEMAVDEDGGEDLEIAEIIRYKILFASRPEPVGTEAVIV